MEHPVFTLSTKPDISLGCYQNGDNSIEVSPITLRAGHGAMTVMCLIYCIANCMAALNEGRERQPVRCASKPMTLLVATNRQDLRARSTTLKDALRPAARHADRETNIRQGGRSYFKVFGLIDPPEIIRETRQGRARYRITLSIGSLMH